MKEFIPPFLMGAFGFMLFMMSDLMFILVDQVVNRGAPLLPALKVLFLRVPAFLVLAFPVATLFATFSSVTNLESNSEITAVKVLGIRFYNVMAPYIGLGILISCISWAMNETVVPSAMRKSQEIVRTMIFRSKAPMIEPNIFFKTPSGEVVLVRSLNKKTKELSKIIIMRLNRGIYPQIITARRGYYDETGWHLKHGILTELDSNGMIRNQVKFEELDVPIRMTLERMKVWRRTAWEMRYSELKERAEELERMGLKASELRTDMYAKISLPFGCLIVIFLAVPLSLMFARAGKFVGITLSVIFLFIYYSLFSVFLALGKRGTIPPLLGAWGANLLMLILGIVLAIRYEYK